MNTQVKEAIQAGIYTVTDIATLTGLDRLAVVAELKALDRKGQGRFVVGRKGHESRFEPHPEPVRRVTPKVGQIASVKMTQAQAIVALKALATLYGTH